MNATIDPTTPKDALDSLVDDTVNDDMSIALVENSNIVSYWVPRADNGNWVRDESLDELLYHDDAYSKFEDELLMDCLICFLIRRTICRCCLIMLNNHGM